MIDPLPGDIFRKGQVLNNTYEIEGVLGRGGTGEVYRARNQITGRVVAVKALNREFSQNDSYLELMKREEEMRNIQHDAVVRYTDCSRTAEGHVYLVMDHVDGTSLAEWLERGGADPRDLVIVAHRVAEGLVATHARNIVHRDISPDNIILRGGEPAEAVLIDFGIAKDASAGARTIVGNDFAGKYEYAAPEQMHGRAEPRSDLYALGASLLATFRGRVPDVGGSPGEVVRRKDQPLDTAGVPEPLKGLIDTLAQPDPARRPPSAAAAVAEIDALLKPAAAPAPRRRRRLWPVLLPLALLVLVAGLALPGVRERLFSRPLPVASPYLLTADRPAAGAATLSGNAPDAAARDAVAAAFAQASGGSPAPEALALAGGAPVADWGAAATELLAVAAPLEEWRLELADAQATLTGVAADAAGRDAVTQAFNAAATARGLTPEARIAAGPLTLTMAEVQGLLAPLQDCGPLVPADPGGAGFPLGATVTVTGNVAERGRIEAIRDALAARIGDRRLQLDLAPLTPGLCSVIGLLPAVPAGGISVGLGFGDRDGPNLAGTYAVGDNPVIDILMPATLTDGHLWVVVADVSGSVYNLLPTLYHPATAISELGVSDGRIRRIRVAHSAAEQAADPTKLAFTVDERFGKSAVIAFYSDLPLFDELRPSEELAASFVEELQRTLAAGKVKILSISTQFVDSRG